MSDTSSGNDWELVTGVISSHPSLDSTSNDAGVEGGAEGGPDGVTGTVDSGVGSGYFLCNPTSPTKRMGFPSCGGIERFDEMKPTGMVSTAAPVEDSYPVKDVKNKQVEDLDFSSSILMSDSCNAQLHDLSKLDWMEPLPPGTEHRLLEHEGSELGSTSNPDSFSSKIKATLERESRQVGPLLGSCMSAPSSPIIVSRDNSFRRSLSDDIVGEAIGGDATSQRPCLTAVEADTLSSVEHEILLAHSALISPDSDAGVSREEGSTSSLQDECASETWWSKQVYGRQASTYWSLALAAAVMGLFIIGHRWQYKRRQNQQLRLRLIAKDEKIGQLILQLARLKEALSGRRRVPVLRSGSYLGLGSFNCY
uniref:DUF6821 domain-containing protein n=1 Tax=Physcomitrium patens TaxID=3218 RepID=A0A7I4EKW1_PHYPA